MTIEEFYESKLKELEAEVSTLNDQCRKLNTEIKSQAIIKIPLALLGLIVAVGIGVVVGHRPRAPYDADTALAFACGYVAAQRSVAPGVNQETDFCRVIRETAIRNGFTAAH